MTTRPRLRQSTRQAVGVLALALFAVLSAVFLTSSFGEAAGFPGDGSITAAIGYAMFNLDAGAFPSEGFIVAFEVIDFVLVAALAAAVMLARREGEGGGPLSLRADGGDDPGDDEGGDR